MFNVRSFEILFRIYRSPKLAALQHEAVSLFQYNEYIKAGRKKDSSIKIRSVETLTWFVKVLAFSVTVIESHKMKSNNRNSTLINDKHFQSIF